MIKAFEKAKKLRIKRGDNAPSDIDVFEDISFFIEEKKNVSRTPNRYKQLYTNAKKLLNKKEDISIKKMSIVNGLCELIGHANYEDFCKSMGLKPTTLINKKLIIIGIICLVTISSLPFLDRDYLMIWDNTQYKEVPFKPNSFQEYQDKNVKLSDPLLVENFKKIIPTCSTDFFKPDGSENLWYGKKENGKLEYFTHHGVHPETGETLKKITPYMIKKYICETYKD